MYPASAADTCTAAERSSQDARCTRCACVGLWSQHRCKWHRLWWCIGAVGCPCHIGSIIKCPDHVDSTLDSSLDSCSASASSAAAAVIRCSSHSQVLSLPTLLDFSHHYSTNPMSIAPCPTHRQHCVPQDLALCTSPINLDSHAVACSTVHSMHLLARTWPLRYPAGIVHDCENSGRGRTPLV